MLTIGSRILSTILHQTSHILRSALNNSYHFKEFSQFLNLSHHTIHMITLHSSARDFRLPSFVMGSLGEGKILSEGEEFGEILSEGVNLVEFCWQRKIC